MSKKAYNKLWIFTLVGLVILMTSTFLAAWTLNVKEPPPTSKDTPIKFGEGGTVTTVLNVSDQLRSNNKVLVPKELTNINPDTQTQEIVFTLTLLWDQKEDSPGNAGDVEFLGELDYSYVVEGLDNSVKGLINVVPEVIDDTIYFKTLKTIKIKVSLTIPENEEQYQLIKGNEITINLKINIKNAREK